MEDKATVEEIYDFSKIKKKFGILFHQGILIQLEHTL